MKTLKTFGTWVGLVLLPVLCALAGHVTAASAGVPIGQFAPMIVGATVVGASVLTLADWAKRLDPDGTVPEIVEMLSITNEILDDMMWMEGNLPTGHRTTVRTGLPTVAWRLLNQGTQPSKSRTAQIDEQCGIMEAWSEVDVEVAKLGGNAAGFRLTEAGAFIEAMNQQMATTLFYGNAGINPEQFTGLSVRYSSLSAGNAQNIIDAGGVQSDNTSIWLVVWGPNTVAGIFPRGSIAGLQHNDYGEVTIQSATGIGTTRLRAFQDMYQWKCGIALRDWRYAVRIANIDVSNLTTESTPADLTNKMIRAIARIPALGMGRAAWYMNRTSLEMLDIQRRIDVRVGGQLTYDTVDGKSIPTFRGIPIRTTDSILLTEARVT